MQEFFIVNADSIRAYINTDSTKATAKGGFAIGGFNPAKRDREEFLRVTRDSTRIYLNETGTKSGKGGFAIGGFNVNKGNFQIQDYLRVTSDSIRLYINNNPPVKGAKGGFAIGGFNTNKTFIPNYLSVSPYQTNIQVKDSLKGFSVSNVQEGVASDFMNINKINYSIGHESGLRTNPNISLIKGKYNVFLGYKAGFKNVEGYGNIFLGHESGYNTEIGSYNVYMGFRSGQANINGNSNVFIGYQTGEKSTAGWNVYVGQGAGRWNDAGTRNTYIGCQAGIEDGEYGTPGNDNVYIGYRAGATNFIGNTNVYIGSYAGETNNNYSSGRVFIGNQAGRYEANGNRLYIDNSSTSTPLIYGEFNSVLSTRQLTINGKTTTNGSFNYGPDAASATDSYVVSIQGITAYVTGLIITFKANTVNSLDCTVNVNSLGAKALKIKYDQDPASGYIKAGSIVMAVYDGTNFQMIQPSAI